MDFRAHISEPFFTIRKLLQSTVIQNFFIYSFGSLCLRTISLIIIPLNMRKLTPSDYGTLSLVTSFIAIATAIMGLGLRQVLSIEYFHAHEKARKILINDIIAIYCACAVPTLAIAISYRAFIMQYIFLGTITTSLLLMAFFTIFISFFSELFYQVMQYQQHAKSLTLIQVSISILMAVISITLVWHYELGIAGMIAAQLCGVGLGALAGIIGYCLSHYRFERSPMHDIWLKTPSYLAAGFPFIPAIILSWALSGVNRWMLAYYASMHDVGIYAIADLSTQVFYAVILQPWSGSYLPYIMNRYAQNQDRLEIIETENKKNMYYTVMGNIVLIIIGTIVCQTCLMNIFPISYHASFQYVGVILLGQVFLLTTYFASTLIQFLKKRYFLYFSILIPTIINIFLCFILIPKMGIKGAVISSLLSYVFYCMVTLIYNWFVIQELKKNVL